MNLFKKKKKKKKFTFTFPKSIQLFIRALFDRFKLHFPAKRCMHVETTEFIQVASLFHSVYSLCYPIIIHILKTNLKVLCSVKLHFPARRACCQIVAQKLFCSLEVLHSRLCVWTLLPSYILGEIIY